MAFDESSLERLPGIVIRILLLREDVVAIGGAFVERCVPEGVSAARVTRWLEG